ncbi:amidohydrolase family protein [Candidatus Latescibacterota bacterium]
MRNNLNRRSFIKGASAAAAGVSSINSGNAHANDSIKKPELRKSSVNYLERTNKAYMEKFTIIDAHAHIGEGETFPIPFSYEKDLVDTQNVLGVKANCVSHLTALGVDYSKGNDLAIEAAESFPGRFWCYAVANPHFSNDIIHELTRAFDKSSYVRGVKLHPSFHSYPPIGPNYNPAFEFANERSLTILSHTWGSAENMIKIATKYPNTKLIHAHAAARWAGTKDHIDRHGIGIHPFLEAAHDYENIYVDLCASVAYYGVFEQVVDIAGADNILYGSDTPYMDAGYQIGRVLLADISDSEKSKIFGLNIARLLGIDV